MLIVGMGAPSPRAQAVESRNPQGRGEVTVTAAATRTLRELQPNPTANHLCLLKQSHDRQCSLHRGPVKRSRHL